MASITAHSSLSDFGDLEESLDAIYEQAEAMLSVTSISSTVTASDLPGAGRTLGNLYSYLGKRLENTVNRLAERRGYGPKAIERRVLTLLARDRYGVPLESYIVKPGSKEEKLIRKDLKRLVAYAESKVDSNRELACQVIISIVFADLRFRKMLQELGATRTLGLVCAREKRDDLCDHLLSPSRKALISVVDSKIHTIGKEWRLLRLHVCGVPQLDSRGYSWRERDEEKYKAYLASYESLVKYIGSSSPEQSFLAMLYYSDDIRTRSRYPILADISLSVLHATRIAFYRLPNLLAILARSIYRIVQLSPHNIDWTVLGFTTLQLVQQVYHLQTTRKLRRYCYEIMEDILVRFSDKMPSDMATSFRERMNPRKKGNGAF